MACASCLNSSVVTFNALLIHFYATYTQQLLICDMEKQKKKNYYIEFYPENVGTRRVASLEGESLIHLCGTPRHDI
jgi:hypothetical protein